MLLPLARWRRSRLPDNFQLIAVVGTFGKSTTTRLVRAMLGLDASMRCTRNTSSFTALSVLRCSKAKQLEVLEIAVGKPGQMKDLAAVVSPTTVVVTSIGSEHRTSMGSLDVTRHEKAFMLRSLPETGNAVLNGDDSNVMWMANETRANIHTFGFNDRCDIRILNHQIDWPRGMRTTLAIRGQTHEFKTRLLGRPGLYAVAAAVTVGNVLGIPMDTLHGRIATLEPTPGRLHLLHLKDRIWFLRDDFKSPRETILEALDTMESIPIEDKLFVLGEEQEPDISQHELYRQIGDRIGRMGGRVVFWGPRGKFRNLRTGFKRAGGTEEGLSHARSIRDVVQIVEAESGSERVILLKGRSAQKLERVALALKNRQLRCELASCKLNLECDACPRWHAGKPDHPNAGLPP